MCVLHKIHNRYNHKDRMMVATSAIPCNMTIDVDVAAAPDEHVDRPVAPTSPTLQF
jgi:hypothetical protein